MARKRDSANRSRPLVHYCGGDAPLAMAALPHHRVPDHLVTLELLVGSLDDDRDELLGVERAVLGEDCERRNARGRRID
jgi:hypothetical protein